MSMLREEIARGLIIRHLRACSSASTHSDELNGVISSLSAIWNLQESIDFPGFPSLSCLVESLSDEYMLSESYVNRGLGSLSQGDFDGAIDCFSKVLLRNQNNVQVRKMRASAYLKRGMFDQAIDDCQTILQSDERDKMTHLKLVFALWSAKRIGDAQIAWSEASAAYPGDATLTDIGYVIDRNP
jgi:tetratricopeptide (TPR) repeat protein